MLVILHIAVKIVENTGYLLPVEQTEVVNNETNHSLVYSRNEMMRKIEIIQGNVRYF